MSQVNAALHCLLPCWYREAPHGEPPPAASRAGGGHPAGPLALRHVNNPALRSDAVIDQMAPTTLTRRRFASRRSGEGMIVTGSWRRQHHHPHADSASTSGSTDSGAEKTPSSLTPSSPSLSPPSPSLAPSSPTSSDSKQVNVIYGHDLRARYWQCSPPPRYSPGLAHRVTGQSSGRQSGLSSSGALLACADRDPAERHSSEADAPPRVHGAGEGCLTRLQPLNVISLKAGKDSRYLNHVCSTTAPEPATPVHSRLNRFLAARTLQTSVEGGWLQHLSCALFEERQGPSRFADAVVEYSLQQLFALAGKQAPQVDERYRHISKSAISQTLLQLAHLHFVVWEYLGANKQHNLSPVGTKYLRCMMSLGKILSADSLDQQSAFDTQVPANDTQYNQATELMNELRVLVMKLFGYNLFGPGNYILQLRGTPFLNHLEALYAEARGLEHREKELLQEFVSADQLLLLKLQRNQFMQYGDMTHGRGYLVAVGEDIRFLCSMGMLTASAALLSERRRTAISLPAN